MNKKWVIFWISVGTVLVFLLFFYFNEKTSVHNYRENGTSPSAFTLKIHKHYELNQFSATASELVWITSDGQQKVLAQNVKLINWNDGYIIGKQKNHFLNYTYFVINQDMHTIIRFDNKNEFNKQVKKLKINLELKELSEFPWYQS